MHDARSVGRSLDNAGPGVVGGTPGSAAWGRSSAVGPSSEDARCYGRPRAVEIACRKGETAAEENRACRHCEGPPK
jgi:hypothetical protein